MCHPIFMVHAHCCVSLWLPRRLHSPLLPDLLLSDHPALLPVNFIFQDVVHKFSAYSCWGPGHPGRERASHRLWAQRVPHHGGLFRIHTGVLVRAVVTHWLRLRWSRHRQDAPWRVPKTSRSLWRRRLVVLSVVVSQSRNSETQLRKWTDYDSSGATKRADSPLADCQAEIRKHELQADYDRRSIQKLNEMIELQKEELHRAQAEERRRQDY